MKNAQIYDIPYFLKKFESIPSEQIGQGALENHCALWHCGVGINDIIQYTPTPEAEALAIILGGDNALHHVYDVNDNFGKRKYPYNSPKERILAALREKQQKSLENNNIVDVKELILN